MSPSSAGLGFIKSIKVLLSEQEIKQIQANYERMHIHNGSDDIAHFLADLAKGKTNETD